MALVACVSALTGCGATRLSAPRDDGTAPRAALARVPLAFEQNMGQTDPRVRYVARGSGYTLFLTDRGPVLSLSPGNGRRASVLRTTLVGSASARPRGERRLPGIVNVLKGPRRNWHVGVHTFGQVRYPSLYPGIDVLYHGRGGALEYDFEVGPRADPGLIGLSMGGARKLSVAANGDLVIAMDGGSLREARPLAYQTLGGARVPVSARYVLREGRVGFRLGPYDHARPLVIDPVLSYSTYLGGPAADEPERIAAASDGSLFVVGSTTSNTFPGPSGDVTRSGSGRTDYDAFVTHLDASGRNILWTTYLGGSGTGTDKAFDVNVDVYGDPIIVGETNSTDFSSSTALDASACSNGGYDAWQAQISTAAGTGIPYLTACFGGNGDDVARGVASRLTGSPLSATNPRRVEVFVTGSTTSSAASFPVVNGYPNTNTGSNDAFLVRSRHVCSSGSCNYIDYGTFLGDTGNDVANDVAVHGGNAYITGSSNSDFLGPTTMPGGTYGNAFVAEFNPNNTSTASLVYVTGFGSATSVDAGYAIAVSSGGAAYIAGENNGGGLPGTNNLQLYYGNSTDAFVGVLNSSGTPTKAIYVGASGADAFHDIALTETGGVVSFYAVGEFTGIVSDSAKINGLAGQSCSNSDEQVGVLKEADTPAPANAYNTTVIYFTCLGGSSGHGDVGMGLAPGPNGSVWVTGDTGSFPTTSDGRQTSYGGGTDDGFIAQISPRAPVIDGGPSGAVASTDATFTFHSDDTGMAFACSDASNGDLLGSRSAVSCTGNGTTTYTGLNEGPHTFQVSPLDAGGTEGPVTSRDFTVDTTPPGAFDLISPAEGATTGTQPDFSWAETSDATTVTYQLMVDDSKLQDVPASACSGGTCTAQAARALLGGPHKWKIVATDAAGNETTSTSTRGFTVADPPTAKMVIAPNPALVGKSVTFDASSSADASHTIATYEWDLDGDGSFETNTGATATTTHSYPKAGAYNVGLRVTATSGQVGTTTAPLTITDLSSSSGVPIGVSINKGAQYTNHPEVTLEVVPPATTTSILVSNDGGFVAAKTFLPSGAPASAATAGGPVEIKWTLDSSGPERLPKTVYVRFLVNTFASPNYTDDIILDERPPVVDAASVVGGASAASVAKLRKFTVKVKAHDTNSGVGGVQIAISKKKPGKLLAYKSKVTTKHGARPKFIRAKDRAGNFSPWKKLR